MFSTVAWAGPDDIVPRGDIAYDLLGRLAAAGDLPGYSRADFLRGDRLYTRAEIAALTGRAKGDSLPLSILRREFAGGAPSRLPNKPFLGAQLKARGHSDPWAGDLTVRVAALAPVGRDGYAAAMGGAFRSEFSRGGFPAIETAYVVVPGRALDLEIGRRPRRWGAGFTGGMMLSDESPAITGVALSKSFLLPGRLGRRLGRLRFEQIHGQFFETDDRSAPPNARGTRRDVGFRRFETENSGRWRLAYAEGFKATRLPDAVYVPFLPWYAYEHDWTRNTTGRIFGLPQSGKQPNSFWLNFAAELSAAYRLDARGGNVFAHFLLDDLEAPKGLGLGNRVPRRIGWLTGAYWPDLRRDGGTLALRVEAALVDPRTFLSDFAPMHWRQGDQPLGYPVGADARVFFARIDFRPDSRDSGALEWQSRRRRDARSMAPQTDRLRLVASRALDRNRFVAARLDWERNRSRVEIGYGVGW